MVLCTEFFGWVVVLRAAAWVVCAVRMVPCRAKNTSIKLPNCIKLAFHFI